MTYDIEELLESMSMEEKIAQTDMGMGVRFFDRTHPAYFGAIREDAHIDREALDQMIGPDGIGFIHSVYSSPQKANELMRYCLEHTRRKIPPIILCEALHGLHMPDATVFPVPLALAASFDTELVRFVGQRIGYETRATGHREVLNPNLDLARDPRWGRMEETYGEDVHLCSVMGVAMIEGLQGTEPYTVAAEPKHYAVHGIAEGGLNAAPARVGSREILSSHLPIFEAAVRQGGAMNAMASYNSVDGIPVMNHRQLLTELLKERIGLEGYIRSDFAGIPRLVTHHGVCQNDLQAIGSALSAGVDTQGFDYPNGFWREKVKEAVTEGLLPIERLDDAVRRILTVKKRLGLFEKPYTEERACTEVLRGPESQEVAYLAAQESICLLENDGILPLEGKKVGRIALIGPFGSEQPIGGYSPIPYSYAPDSLAEVLTSRGYEVRKAYGCSACGRTRSILPFGWFQTPVRFEYFDSHDQQREPVAILEEENIDQMWLIKKPVASLPDRSWSLRVTATFRVDYSRISGRESLEGRLYLASSDQVSLAIDGKQLIDYETAFDQTDSQEYHQGFSGSSGNERSVPFHFSSGAEHSVELIVRKCGGSYRLAMGYELPDDHIEEAVAAAASSDLVLLSCGDSLETSGEGYDRSTLALPGNQQRLIEAVTEVNPDALLLLHTGRPVIVESFRKRVRAIVQCWFSGDRGAEAIVDVLEGKVNPSGKTPVSWPRAIGHLPCYYARLPGTSSSRYYDGSYQSRYPFGHGLSYTSFEISEACSMPSEDGLRISCQITNTGKRFGKQVIGVYVCDLVSSVVTPKRELKAFTKLGLAPLESREVTFTLSDEAFSLIDRDLQRVVEPGAFELQLGFSSEDIRWNETIQIEKRINL